VPRVLPWRGLLLFARRDVGTCGPVGGARDESSPSQHLVRPSVARHLLRERWLAGRRRQHVLLRGGRGRHLYPAAARRKLHVRLHARSSGRATQQHHVNAARPMHGTRRREVLQERKPLLLHVDTDLCSGRNRSVRMRGVSFRAGDLPNWRGCRFLRWTAAAVTTD
jgi:hypothetical protein